MTVRIFFKQIFAVLLIMVVALTTVDLLSSRLAERAYLSGLKAEITEKIHMLQQLEGRRVLTLTQESVRALAPATGGRLTVIDRTGKVLLDSEADPAKMENHLSRPEVRTAATGRIGIADRRSASVGTRFLYVAGPVEAGVVRIAVPLREVEAQVASLRRELVLYTALAFIPGILLAAFFARYFSRRLNTVVHFASTLATGDFRARLELPHNDEIGILARQLNEMAAKLEAMFGELQREHVELEKLERIRRDFVSNVSHELRTPLASIQGYAETLLDGALEDPQYNVKFLRIIHQNAERLTRLAADLLTLSRLELKRQPMQPAGYYVNRLMEECIDTLRPVAAKKQIAIHYTPVDEAQEMYCDSEAIHQVMMNLLDNAIKYTPEQGRIDVSAAELPSADGAPPMVEVRVRDTGLGIPAEDLPRLFERFYRVDKARSREMGGTGLGLAIVKHLVLSMGGQVTVDSVLNEGSTFRFTLPTQAPVETESVTRQGEFTE